jgi:hypothetical protein
MINGRFAIGERVRLIEDKSQLVRVHPDQLATVYEVVRVVPGERDGEAQYHIRNDAEPHMRAVPEGQLQAA